MGKKGQLGFKKVVNVQRWSRPFPHQWRDKELYPRCHLVNKGSFLSKLWLEIVKFACNYSHFF
jgi:hypothetical protein